VKRTIGDKEPKTVKRLKAATYQPLLPTPKFFRTSLLPSPYILTSVPLLIRVQNSKRFVCFANKDETLTCSNISTLNYDLFEVNDDDSDTLIVDSRKVVFNPNSIASTLASLVD